MKKLILSIYSLILCGSLVAQTHSDLAGNAPTSSGEGYNFEFNGTVDNNCWTGYYGGINNQTWSYSDGNLVVTVPVMTVYDDERQLLKFYQADCDPNVSIDLSNTSNQKFRIELNSTDNGQMVVVIFSGAQMNYAAPGVNVFNVAIGDNTFEVNSLDLTGISDASNITGIGFFFRGPSGWNDPDFAGTVTISSVKIGDALNTTSLKNSVNNSLLSVYPNPAKGQVNVDLSSLSNSNAVIKIMNTSGMTVYEGVASSSIETINTSDFSKGIYVVQAIAGSKIITQKFVVE